MRHLLICEWMKQSKKGESRSAGQLVREIADHYSLYYGESFCLALEIFTIGVSSFYESTASSLLRIKPWQTTEFALRYDLERR